MIINQLGQREAARVDFWTPPRWPRDYVSGVSVSVAYAYQTNCAGSQAGPAPDRHGVAAQAATGAERRSPDHPAIPPELRSLPPLTSLGERLASLAGPT